MSIEARQHAASRPVEHGNKLLRGVGLVIVQADTGDVWVNRDLRAREATGRKAGQLTIPFETSKPGEHPHDTVLGGLVEVYNDVDQAGRPFIPTLRNSLFRVEGTDAPSYIVSHGDTTIDCGMQILVYDGPSALVQPFDHKEAEGFGWMPPAKLLSMDEQVVRPLTRITLGNKDTLDAIDTSLDRYSSMPDARQPVIPQSDFSFREFYEKREKQEDNVEQIVYRNPV